MGFKSLIMILIISILSISCSTVNFTSQPDVTTRDYSRLNYLGSKHNSKIFLLDGEDISTKYIFVNGDSLFYKSSQDTLSIPLMDIEKVEQKNWTLAGGNALVFGLGASLVTFTLMKDDAESPGLGFVVLGYAALVGLSAFVLGIIYGGENEYIFNDKNDYEQIEYLKEQARRDSTNLEIKNSTFKKFE
jgi:hypothetical protein